MTRLIKQLTVTMLIMVFSTVSASGSEQQIIITDSLNNRVQTLSDSKSLNRFHYFWSQKQLIKKSQTYQWRYQLVLITSKGKSRWVYDPAGFSREVSVDKSTPIYQISPVRSFNRFLSKE